MVESFQLSVTTGLRLAMQAGADFAMHRALVKDVLEHLTVYRQSFVWGYHGTETDEDRAALISAVGWCSGWHPWISSVW